MSLVDISTLLGIVVVTGGAVVALAHHFARDNERERRIKRIEKHLNLNGNNNGGVVE